MVNIRDESGFAMRDHQAVCKVVLAGLFTVVLVLAAFPSEAFATGQTFTVRDVAVDESAGDAQEARETALRSAEVIAWGRLIVSMSGANASQVGQPDSQALQSMVQSLEFADEKITTGRYRALVTVRFSSDAVIGWLESFGVAHASTPTPTLLVLPVLETDEGPVLWLEEGNPWLAAWQRNRGSGNIVSVVAPVADLDDLLAIDEAGAMEGNWATMKELLGRYGADGVVVAVARSTSDRINQTLTWYESPSGTNIPVMGAVAADLSETPASVETVATDGTTVISTAPVTGSGDYAADPVAAGNYDGAVEQARASLDSFWSAATAGPEAVMVAEVSIRSLNEWVSIRNLLAMPVVLSQSLPLVVGVDRVRVLLRYAGTLEQLRTGLRQVGLNLMAQGDTWLIIPL